MKILLTGFGPFGTVVNNPSQRIVEHFEKVGLPGHTLTARILPVSFRQAGEQVASLLQYGEFDAALLLGVAQQELGFRLEQVGRNGCRARIPDCEGWQPDRENLLPDAPESYPTPYKLTALYKHLTARGFSCHLSEDAGGYVCNATYFAALHTIAAARLPTRCLFLHLPPAPDTVTGVLSPGAVPLAQQIEAVTRVLHWMAETADA